jgi:hypothetical protein
MDAWQGERSARVAALTVGAVATVLLVALIGRIALKAIGPGQPRHGLPALAMPFAAPQQSGVC